MSGTQEELAVSGQAVVPPVARDGSRDQLGADALAPNELQDPLKTPAQRTQTGGAGTKYTRKDVAAEALKPVVVGGAAGIGAAATAGSSMAPGMGAAEGVGALSTLVGLSTMKKGIGRLMDSDNDDAGVAIGAEQVREGWVGTATGGLSAAQGGLAMANVAKHGTDSVMHAGHLSGAANYAGTALSAAGAQIGIAGSAYNALSALVVGGEAAGRAIMSSEAKNDIFSKKGEFWRTRAQNRQTTKALMQGLKLAASALGIAAGVLILASNPVGWAIGIAGAAVSLGMFLGKVGASVWKRWQARKERKRLQAEAAAASAAPPAPNAPAPAPEPKPKEGAEADAPAEPPPVSVEDAAGVPVAQEAVSQVQASSAEPDKAKIQEVQDLAKKAEMEVSTNARVAHEMHDAVVAGATGQPVKDGKDSPINLDHDAVVVGDALGISRKELASASGKELTEKRLSALDQL